MRNRKPKSISKNIFTYLLLIVIAISTLFPLIWLFGTAFKPSTEDVSGTLTSWLPSQPTWQNFITVWQNYPFEKYLFNSFWIAFITVCLNLILCSLAAYPLARIDFLGRDTIWAFIVSTIMIPSQIIMIPLFILAVNLNLRNTYLGAIIPNLVSTFGIFFLRQAFKEIPKELEEAAKIDGCSGFDIWWNVMIPVVRPALITLAFFIFIGSWSDFLWPLIVLDDPSYYTLPLGIAKLANSLDLDWRLISAGSIISIIPVVFLFILVQQYIIPTDSGSGVKG